MSNYKTFSRIVTVSVFMAVVFFGFWLWQSKIVTTTSQASNSINFFSPTFYSQSLSSVSNLSLQLPDKYTIEKKVKLPILMYHHIATLENTSKTDKIGIGLRVSPAIFERQLQYLVQNNYNTVNSFQIQSYLDGNQQLPKNPILLTFDDGFKNNYDNAFPLLQKYNMTADFAIITSVLGTGEYMNWDNVKEIKSKGMGIASHTDHHCTTAIKDQNGYFTDSKVDGKEKPCSSFAIQEKLTTGQIKYEFEQSKKLLENNLGIRVSHLVYPFGFYNKQAMDIAQGLGYTFATTVKAQKGEVADFDNPFEIGRIRVNGQQTGELNGFFTK